MSASDLGSIGALKHHFEITDQKPFHPNRAPPGPWGATPKPEAPPSDKCAQKLALVITFQQNQFVCGCHIGFKSSTLAKVGARRPKHGKTPPAVRGPFLGPQSPDSRFQGLHFELTH